MLVGDNMTTYYCPITAEQKGKIDGLKDKVSEHFDDFVSHSFPYRIFHIKGFRKALRKTITEGLQPFIDEVKKAEKQEPDAYAKWEIDHYRISLESDVPTVCISTAELREMIADIDKSNDVSWKRATVYQLEKVEEKIHCQISNFVWLYQKPPYQRSNYSDLAKNFNAAH